MNHAKRWIDLVKREVEAPDLWASISKERELLEVAESANATNDPFIKEEKRLIRDRLKEISEYLISTHDLDEEHQEYVKRRFDYLDGAVERLGRQDWLNISISVFLQIALHIALSSDAISDLFRFATNVLSDIFSGIKLLP